MIQLDVRLQLRQKNLPYIAIYEFPVCSFREYLACALDEGSVGVGIALQTIHKPCRGITQISVHAVDTPGDNPVSGTLGLALDVVVTRADDCSFELFNARRCGVVIGLDGFLPGCPGRLHRR